MTVLQPVGVSVMITPWNFPAAMATRKIGPALAAGCTAIVKPASDAADHSRRPPHGGGGAASRRGECGRGQGLIGGDRADAPRPAVRKLSFTGSTEVGQTLLKVAADQVLNVSMELGGSTPFVVFEDADLDAALELRWWPKCATPARPAPPPTGSWSTRRWQKFTSMLAGAMGAMKLGRGSTGAIGSVP